MATAFEVQQFAHGLHWPATKEEVINHARERGADEAVLSTLEALPDTDFTSENHISQSLGAYGARSGSIDT
ncbi:MAG: DUF2795 domain-containing protein [Egibacteraceae bacterium]